MTEEQQKHQEEISKLSRLLEKANATNEILLEECASLRKKLYKQAEELEKVMDHNARVRCSIRQVIEIVTVQLDVVPAMFFTLNDEERQLYMKRIYDTLKRKFLDFVMK